MVKIQSLSEPNQRVGIFAVFLAVKSSPAYLFNKVQINQCMAKKHVCPYCESVFEATADLSKHIDRIHHGSGLLEGDSRRF